jgi:alkylation response protein AidB-like acyl-CoA dehydrogenase
MYRQAGFLVPSLELDDTRQHGPARDGRSSQLSITGDHEASPDVRSLQTTQIYEGTNQIQRIVIAKRLGL